ncbi:hypothetical protein [Arcticibacterium luteifluviistationis]
MEIKRAFLSSTSSQKEIASKLSFDGVSNFTKFFKNHTRLTPKDYKSGI